MGIVFAFDGAARGNPGAASYGICGWWGYFNTDGFFPCGLLLQRGVRLGTGTNNVAEAHALANSVKICLRYYFWIAEQLSQLAQHSS